MIISLRGTSGSGKSTLVRAVTALYARGVPCVVPGRRRPLYVTWVRQPATGTSLMVPGHYEIGNGGVDTLDTLDQAYELAIEHDKAGRDVLMEGKCMSDGVPHVAALHASGRDVRVVHIMLPPEECHRAVLERGHNISRDSVAKTHAKIDRNMGHFRSIGVRCVTGNRSHCLNTVKWWLSL